MLKKKILGFKILYLHVKMEIAICWAQIFYVWHLTQTKYVNVCPCTCTHVQ